MALECSSGIRANFTKRTEAQSHGWVFDKGDFHHDPAARPNIPALKNNLAMLHDLGFLPLALDPVPPVDLRLVGEAGRGLK